MKWVCDVINHTSMKSKDYNIPAEMFKGETPDISMFRYHFWQPIYYFDPNMSFPRPNLLPACWLGIAWDTGDVLTFHIKTEPKDKRMSRVLTRSVIRPRLEQDDCPICSEDVEVPMFTKIQQNSMTLIKDNMEEYDDLPKDDLEQTYESKQKTADTHRKDSDGNTVPECDVTTNDGDIHKTETESTNDSNENSTVDSASLTSSPHQINLKDGNSDLDNNNELDIYNTFDPDLKESVKKIHSIIKHKPEPMTSAC